MKVVNTPVYVAKDGTTFFTEEECLKHEAKAELDDAFECAYMYGEYRSQTSGTFLWCWKTIKPLF